MWAMAREPDLAELLAAVRACRACADALPHGPRPVVQAAETARVLVIGQAPGSKVHASGRAWDDDSGDRLRDWTGLSNKDFYDPSRVAHMPSGFCYPGKGQGGDLPPRPECAPQWHDPLLARLPDVRLILLVGQYAQKRYLARGFAPSMTEAVRRWREAGTRQTGENGFAELFPLPHPAWRSRIWMARNPWFEAEVLPDLRKKVGLALGMAPA